MRKSDGRKKGSSKRIRSRFRELFTSTASLLGIITFLVLVIIMLVIFISEQETNSKINTLFDAFWYTLVTITTVGYGDITPDSVPGRIAAMVLLIAGVALFGALSGKFASFLFDRQQKRDKGLLNMAKMKNHFLICGWKPNFERILAGILNANPEVPNEKIVILNSAGQGEIDRIKSDSRFKGINYLHGDFTDEDTLLKAQIKTAERALILADLSENYSALENDSRAVLAVITMKNLNPRIYCVAEITDSKFEKHLSLARCDEIILSSDYEQNLLVQASSGKGMSHILRELIAGDSGAGIVIESIPQEFVGKPYRDYRISLRTRDVLIGLLENTGNFYQRRKEALAEAQKNPDMEKIVANLKKVKTLQSNLPHFTPEDDYIVPGNSKAIFIHGNNADKME
ncbi:MAG: ion channel [Treponema porcinum]|uniref:potassium channel protein n=1 Tax=Treponema porcinum TaxID=261392 RepID=UPI0023570626|nr:potassium channel family protein [Treponema porcinum]MCI6481924.1 ion channel [Treponema porcinum]MDY5122159.1 ion channel [Treponema porcinum]